MEYQIKDIFFIHEQTLSCNFSYNFGKSSVHSRRAIIDFNSDKVTLILVKTLGADISQNLRKIDYLAGPTIFLGQLTNQVADCN